MADQFDIYDQAIDQLDDTPEASPDVSSVPEPEPAPAVDIYDQAIGLLEADEQDATKQSILDNGKRDIDPVRQAEALRISREQGIPVEAVYDDIERFRPKPTPDVEKILSDAPAASRLLADPAKGPALFPDYEKLTEAEKTLKVLNDLKAYSQKNVEPARGWGMLSPEEGKAEQERRLRELAEERKVLEETKARREQEAQERRARQDQAAQGFVDFERERGITIDRDPMAPWIESDLENVGAADSQIAANDRRVELYTKIAPTMTRLRDQVQRGVQFLGTWPASLGAGTIDYANAILTLLSSDEQAPAPAMGTAPTPVDVVRNPFFNETSKFSSVGSYGQSTAESSPTPPIAPEQFDKIRNVFAEMEQWVIDNVPTDRARDEDFVSKLNSGILSAGTFLAAGWAARALGVSSMATTAVLGSLSGAREGSKDAAANNATPDQQAWRTIIGGIASVSEIFPVERYLGWAEQVGGPFWQRLLAKGFEGIAVEGGQELGQGLPGDIYAQLTYDPERNIFANAWENFAVGGTVGAIFGAISAAGDSVVGQRKEALDRYADIAASTNTAQVNSELLEEHLAEMKKTGVLPETVTAPVEAVEALFQTADPAVVAANFPEITRAIEEARASGSEVSIPAEKIAKLAQLEGFKTFTENVRTDPDAPTVAEQKKLQEDIDRVLSEMDTETPAATGRQSPVFTTIQDQLVKAGQSAEVAAPIAKLYEAFFTTQAQRTGMQPEDLLRRYGLEISSSEITAEQLGPQLDALRAGATPETAALQSQLAAAGITPQALGTMSNEQVAQAIAERTLAQMTKTPEFKTFFKSSKAVTETGEPLRVYHGTVSVNGVVHDVFDPDKRGLSTAAQSARDAFWFSASPDNAAEFANLAEYRRREEGDVAPAIIPAYLSLQNPLEIDASSVINFSDTVKQAKDEGYDGVIFRNANDTTRPPALQVGDDIINVDHRGMFMSDSFPAYLAGEMSKEDVQSELNEAVKYFQEELDAAPEGEKSDYTTEVTNWTKIRDAWVKDPSLLSIYRGPPADVYAVFEPTQIKSAIGNRGTFDPNEPNIFMQSVEDPSADVRDVEEQVEAAGGKDIRADQVDALVDDDRIPVIALKDLVGKTIFPTIADRTAAGALYRGVDGSQLELAVPLLGGPLFPLRQSNVANDVVWANRGDSVVTAKGKKVASGAKYMAVLMGDADMHQSNTTVANAFFATLEAYARDGRVTPENSAKLVDLVRNSPGENEQIRKALETFPGMTDAKALDTYLHKISFEARKRLLDILGNKGAQELGAPSMTKILRATREQSMATHRWGDAVLVVEIDENKPFIKLGEQGTTEHPDFPLGIRGKVVGKFAAPINYELLWQDYLADRSKTGGAARVERVTKLLEEAANATNDKDTQKALKNALKAAQRDPNNRRAFDLAKPELKITQELVDRIGDIRPNNIDGFRQARLAVDMVSRNWRRSDTKKNQGGVSPQAFLDAVANSDYSATLTAYDLGYLKKGIKNGSWLINQLGNGEIYYALKRGNPGYADDYGFTHPEVSDNEVTLVSVVNNEQGARGIAGPAILLDAIEKGATILDAFGVKTPKFPDGFLPTLYGAFGFEKIGEIPFDPQYYDKNKLADVEAAWSRDGWNKDRDGYPPLVIMKWKGTDADRQGILERYLRSGIEDLLAGRAHPNAAASTADFDEPARQSSGQNTGADARGAAGDPGARRGASLASRARDVIGAIAGLNDAELKNLGLTRDQQLRILDALGRQASGKEQKAPSPGPSSSQGATTLNQNARGFITFNNARDKFRITLTGQANLSTFLHESGHFFLEVMQDLVERGAATDQQRQDLEALRQWMGLKPGDKLGVPQHEKFARGFEAYLMEGKAPSTELAGILQKFKSWLVFVYRSLAGLNVKLTDEVRGVMDRLLASDQAIQEARAQVGWRGQPMSQEATGLTDAEYQAYTEAWIKANDAQSQDADARVMLEAARELKKVWRDEKIAMTKAAEAELAKTRSYRAWKLLESGEGLEDVRPGWSDIKIDPASIPSEWRRDATGMTAASFEGGLPLDDVAEILGFRSGEEMLSVIAGARAAQKAIPAKVRGQMEAKHGKMDANALALEASKAVHNKPTMDVLLTEFRAMATKARQNTPKNISRILAAQAEEKVAQLTQRQLEPAKWRRAELKAATEAGAAAARGDANAAFLAKRRQMVAAHMHKATLDAQDRIEKIRDYLATFQTDRRRAQLGKAGDLYLDGVDQILEAIELKDVSLKVLKKRPLLQEIVERAIAEDEPINIPPEVLGLGKKNYSQLTLGELEAVHDAVKNLWTLAKLKNELKTRQGKIAMDKAMDHIEQTAKDYLGTVRQPDNLNPTAIDSAINSMRWVRAKLVKMEFLFSWLDGKPSGGLAHQLIYQPIADARSAEYKLMKDLTHRILDPIREMPREQRLRWDTKRQFMGQTMKGANIIAVALNLGNEQNKAKLLQGYNWNEQQLMAELNQYMTRADWDMVQRIWDAIESLWPHIERVSKNATGLAPPRVAPASVQTPFGEYSGGYYPIVYDPFRTQRMAEKQEANAAANGLFTNNFLRPTLANGFTKKRTGYVAPIYLSLDVLSQHLAETVHYVTHYEAVKQADKIRSHPKFQALVTDTMGREFWKEIRPWLQDIANNVTQRRYPELGEGFWRRLRIGTSVASMGFNIGTGIQQLFGITTSLDAIGPRYWATGVRKAWLSPKAASNWRFALKESQELEPLIRDFDREVKQVNDAYTTSIGKNALTGIAQAAFWHIGHLQLVVNVATWHGAYEQAVAEGRAHADAVMHADSVVRKTQSAGATKDLADVQRSGEATKLLTMFYSYFSVLYNRLEDIGKQTNSVKDVPRAAMRVALLSVVPAMLNIAYKSGYAALTAGDDDEEDEDAPGLATRIGLESVNQLIGAVPLLRNLISFGEFGGTNVPAFNKVQQMERAATALKDWAVEGETPTRNEIRTTVNVISTLTQTPIYPIYKQLDDLFGEKISDALE